MKNNLKTQFAVQYQGCGLSKVIIKRSPKIPGCPGVMNLNENLK